MLLHLPKEKNVYDKKPNHAFGNKPSCITMPNEAHTQKEPKACIFSLRQHYLDQVTGIISALPSQIAHQ